MPRTVDLRRFLRRTVPLEKRLPVASCLGLLQLAQQVFPAMERAAWPGSGFPASPKKIGWRGWTERAQLLHRGLSRTRTPLGTRAMTQARRCRESRHIAVDTRIAPWDTRADVTDRAQNRSGLTSAEPGGTPESPWRCKACWEPRWKETQRTAPWCCRSDGWWSGLSPGWKSAADSGAKESSIPACPVEMVVLAFTVLILKRS